MSGILAYKGKDTSDPKHKYKQSEILPVQILLVMARFRPIYFFMIINIPGTISVIYIIIIIIILLIIAMMIIELIIIKTIIKVI